MSAMKRKRSTSDLHSSRSDASSMSPTPSSQLGSRTMKRHRDDRPEDQVVHAKTLAMLFDAQRRAHSSPPPPTTPTEEHEMTMDMNAAGQQKLQRSTLHRFWGGMEVH